MSGEEDPPTLGMGRPGHPGSGKGEEGVRATLAVGAQWEEDGRLPLQVRKSDTLKRRYAVSDGSTMAADGRDVVPVEEEAGLKSGTSLAMFACYIARQWGGKVKSDFS